MTVLSQYQDRLDLFRSIIGSDVEDNEGIIWTVYDVNIRNVNDPLILLWDRNRGGTKYVGGREYNTFASVSSN